jgi:hypothetical protein
MSVTQSSIVAHNKFLTCVGSKKIQPKTLAIAVASLRDEKYDHSLKNIENAIKELSKINGCDFVMDSIVFDIGKNFPILTSDEQNIVVRLATRVNNPDLLVNVEPFSLNYTRSKMYVDQLVKCGKHSTLRRKFMDHLRQVSFDTVWQIRDESLDKLIDEFVERLADIFKLFVISQSAPSAFDFDHVKHRRFTTLEAETILSAKKVGIELPVTLEYMLNEYQLKCRGITLSNLDDAHSTCFDSMDVRYHKPAKIVQFQIVPESTVPDPKFSNQREVFQAVTCDLVIVPAKDRTHREDTLSPDEKTPMNVSVTPQVFVTLSCSTGSIITGRTFVEGQIVDKPRIDAKGDIHVRLNHAVSSTSDCQTDYVTIPELEKYQRSASHDSWKANCGEFKDPETGKLHYIDQYDGDDRDDWYASNYTQTDDYQSQDFLGRVLWDTMVDDTESMLSRAHNRTTSHKEQCSEYMLSMPKGGY